MTSTGLRDALTSALYGSDVTDPETILAVLDASVAFRWADGERCTHIDPRTGAQCQRATSHGGDCGRRNLITGELHTWGPTWKLTPTSYP